MTDGPVNSPDVSDVAGIAPRVVAHRPGADLVVPPLAPAPRRLRPLPTLLLRFIVLVGMSGLIGLLAKATIDSLRESRWEQPRPVLTAWMGISAATLLVGGTLWAVVAAINARRADLGGAPSPLLAPTAALVIVGSGVAIDRLLTTHRTLAFEIWLGLALLLYSYVVLTYRVVGTVLGEIDQHFGSMALLPLMSGAMAVWAIHSEWLLFGMPMVAAMLLWLVAETQLAMFGWDRACRSRIEGRDPHDKPVVQQFAEALKAASASPHLNQDGSRESYHHTLVPRAMVMASLALGLTLPLWVILLENKGHLSIAGVHTTIDDEAGRLLTGLVGASLATYAIGWVWWAVAAALNAQSKSHWSVSPWSAPVGYAASVVAVGIAPIVVDRVDPDIALVVVLAIGLLLASAHFLVLRAYRSTAEGIGGARRPWTLVIAIPWMALGFSIFAAFLAKALPDDPFERIMQISWMVFYATYAVSLYLAMSSFDRACRGRSFHSSGRDALPEFLKRRRVGADTRP